MKRKKKEETSVCDFVYWRVSTAGFFLKSLNLLIPSRSSFQCSDFPRRTLQFPLTAEGNGNDDLLLKWISRQAQRYASSSSVCNGEFWKVSRAHVHMYVCAYVSRVLELLPLAYREEEKKERASECTLEHGNSAWKFHVIEGVCPFFIRALIIIWKSIFRSHRVWPRRVQHIFMPVSATRSRNTITSRNVVIVYSETGSNVYTIGPRT